MPAKEAFRCFRGFRCFRDSVGAPWNRDFVDFVEIVLFVGYREIVISLKSLVSCFSGGTVESLKSLKPLVSFAVIPSFYRLSLRWARGGGRGFRFPLCPLALSRFLRRAAAGACKNRSAAPAAPSLLHPLDALGAAALWTPYPPLNDQGMSPWTQMRKVAPGVWLKKLFTARQMYCASLFPGSSHSARPADETAE